MKIPAGTDTGSIRPGGNRTLVLFLLLSVGILPVLSQQPIEINVHREPLNELLMDLSRKHSFQVSFDDRLLSEYRVTLHETFASPEEAISFLVGDIPVDYRIIGEVYTFFREDPPEAAPVYPLSGRVVDAYSGEALPYSHLVYGNTGMTTGAQGMFGFTVPDSAVRLKVTYLGYFVLDTLLGAGRDHVLGLVPSAIGLKEVVIRERRIERSGQSGDEAGTLRLNHQIAYRLPGNGDNSVYNFLRLQPGILAAGERTSELVIWGSQSGQSMILFDGITLFGLKNFNDNIGFINPYLSKDIRILKGGYGSRYGNRVGGIVEVTGANGSLEKPSIRLNINNMTANGVASAPLSPRSSLTVAYRHSYYNLYDPGKIGILASGRAASDRSDITLYPDYTFRDMNVKYAGTTRGGDPYFVSLYDGKDRFSYSLEQTSNNLAIQQDSEESNRQQGGSAFFGKTWKNGVISDLTVSYSRLVRELEEVLQTEQNGGPPGFDADREDRISNRVSEASVKNTHRIPVTARHTLETGWNLTLEQAFLEQDSVEHSLSGPPDGISRAGLYVEDRYRPFRRLTIVPGFRLDLPFALGKTYFQPRLRASFDLSGRWRLNAASGVYNQFVSQASETDELGNTRYYWTLAGHEPVPVLQSLHGVLGVHFRGNGLSAGTEVYYKTTDGIFRTVINRRQGTREDYTGSGRAYGMDLLVKYYFRKHEAWASYSLGKSEETFPVLWQDEYRDAPQDQRHELKGALLLNLEPFYFTANYVYGSGFRIISDLVSEDRERIPYNRLDVAFIYRHSFGKVGLEAGVSVLNVLNYENVTSSNLIRIAAHPSSSISIHTEAVPFTPTLYLSLSY